MVNNSRARPSGLHWPGLCVLCARYSTAPRDLCAACLDTLPRIGHGCPRCALQGPQLTCARCLQRPPPFDCVVSALDYVDPVSGLIGAFKFGRQRAVGRVLTDLLAPRVAARTVDALVPVPLHWRRRWRRGFNQAEDIAEQLAAATGAPLRHLVLRRRSTAAQSSRASAAERRRNVAGAFRLRGPLDGLHIALVDDVVTTGTTVAEIAALMKRGGAREVEVWCLARTPRQR